jgi:hypothetical protein
MRAHPTVSLLLSALLSLVACGDDGAPGADAATPDAGEVDATVADAATPDAATLPPFRTDLVGTLLLVESEFAGPSAGVWAWIHDRPDEPQPVQIDAAGDCSLWQRPAPGFCDPPCGGTCLPDGTCVPFPVFVDVGEIAVSGLLAPLTFVPDPGTGIYDPTPVPGDDVFTSGAAITAVAEGFSLSATGVPPLVTDAQVVELHDGLDTVIAWTPEGVGRVQVALRLGWHGAPWTDQLLCETADDGSVTIPAALASQFPYFEGGLFQVPSSLTRFERDVVETAEGPIELLVGSSVLVYVMHPLD